MPLSERLNRLRPPPIQIPRRVSFGENSVIPIIPIPVEEFRRPPINKLSIAHKIHGRHPRTH